MSDETRRALDGLLRDCKDIFAFGPEEMSEISPAVMEHWLNMDPSQVGGLKEETYGEFQYPEWISNVVLIKKPNGSW